MIQTTQDISTKSKPLIAEQADFIGQVKKGSTNQMLRCRIFQIFRICTLRAGDPYIKNNQNSSQNRIQGKLTRSNSEIQLKIFKNYHRLSYASSESWNSKFENNLKINKITHKLVFKLTPCMVNQPQEIQIKIFLNDQRLSSAYRNSKFENILKINKIPHEIVFRVN